jgi:hypothetical protein
MGRYGRDTLLLKLFQQEPGLGTFAAAFTPLKGDEQSQGLPRFPFAAMFHAPVTGVETAASS